jgi:steroid 5-alpha reductase family enzyme
MFIIALPLQVVMLSCGPTLSRLDWVGVALWFFGWLFETAADYQLLKFKKQPANKGLVMNKGVWRYSRHPNYFGETVVWWGIFIISISSGYWYISILSPLLITFLLLKVSGVTLLEKRYAGNDAYAEYKKITSSFFPLPPKNVSRK